MNKIILKYNFGDLVMPFIGDKIYRVVSISKKIIKLLKVRDEEDSRRRNNTEL
jgi:hypothetical protein